MSLDIFPRFVANRHRYHVRVPPTVRLAAAELRALRDACGRAVAVRAAAAAIATGDDPTPALAVVGMASADVVAMLRTIRLGPRVQPPAPETQRVVASWHAVFVVGFAADLERDAATRTRLAGLRGRIVAAIVHEIRESEIDGDASDGNTSPD